MLQALKYGADTIITLVLDKLISNLVAQILKDIQRAPLVVYALLWKSFPDAE